jgi:hypothetical protein
MQKYIRTAAAKVEIPKNGHNPIIKKCMPKKPAAIEATKKIYPKKIFNSKFQSSPKQQQPNQPPQSSE